MMNDENHMGRLIYIYMNTSGGDGAWYTVYYHHTGYYLITNTTSHPHRPRFQLLVLYLRVSHLWGFLFLEGLTSH